MPFEYLPERFAFWAPSIYRTIQVQLLEQVPLDQRPQNAPAKKKAVPSFGVEQVIVVRACLMVWRGS